MGATEWIAVVGISLTVFSGIGILIYRTGLTMSRIDIMLSQILEMKTQVDKIQRLEMRVEELWRKSLIESNSPIELDEASKKIRIEEFVFKYYNEIIGEVRRSIPKNSYQAQESIIQVVLGYKFDVRCSELLQILAFDNGRDVNAILLVAAITIRDRVLIQLGFKVDNTQSGSPAVSS